MLFHVMPCYTILRTHILLTYSAFYELWIVNMNMSKNMSMNMSMSMSMNTA
jgi:hypothetical protein